MRHPCGYVASVLRGEQQKRFGHNEAASDFELYRMACETATAGRHGITLDALKALTPAERLASLRAATEGRIVFTTSFGLEDQVLTHLIATAGHDIEIATLDTGRLFPETYETWARTEARYGLRVRAFYPDRAALEAWVGAHGIDGFYESRAVRESCCAVRKVERDHLVVYIEAAGDFIVRGPEVQAIHYGKVILDPSRVDTQLLEAAQRAHERESDEAQRS